MKLEQDRFLIREINDILLLLDSKNGEMFRLNETASFIWTNYKSNNSVDKTSQALAENYAITFEEAKNEVQHFVSEMNLLYES